MANYNQAPAIVYQGEKNRDSKKWGKAIRTHELETAIMCGLGERDFAAMKVMLFLTGNAEGFQVAEKTIMERCNISESAYKNARKKLVEKGWIICVPGKSITVNYNAIYKGISQNTPIKEKEKTEGYCQNTPQGISQNTPQGYCQNTYNNITNNIKEYDKGEAFSAKAEKSSINYPEVSLKEMLGLGVPYEVIDKENSIYRIIATNKTVRAI